MEGALKASTSYVSQSIASGASLDQLDMIRKTQVTHLRNQFSRMHGDLMEDGTRALALLGASPFDPIERSTLLSAIHSTIADTTIASDLDNTKTQTNLYIYNYLTDYYWGIISDKSKLEDERIDAMIDLTHMIGMRFPCVPTKK